MDIQWYPGHMTKARRNMERDVKLVDLVIELRDARAPYSTENPDIRRLSGNKKRLILLNKADLADGSVTKLWIEHYRKQGLEALALDARNRDFLSAIKASIGRLSAEKEERDRKRGITEKRPVKALICGIPNIGKSTFINSVLGRASAKTGNKPGVTKGNQWISVSSEFLLLDTPGVLWPKFDDKRVGVNLALMGSVNDEILNKEELCLSLLSYLREAYPELLDKRYEIDKEELERTCEAHEEGLMMLSDSRALAYMDLIARKRGTIKRGAQPDYERCAALIIDDFRSGRLGRISLERPQS
ncbi:MAG TPA: ribosome biogenesis GTPase YlqF [Candidatus Avilachnospira avistercoris]|nr:ribosome biogenesis GTPase YlqF [Candidatus Avilachnospira avistercoris]